MIATVVGFSAAGTAFIRPDGADRNLAAPKRVAHSCGFAIDYGDRVDVRIAPNRIGEMVVTKIEPAT